MTEDQIDLLDEFIARFKKVNVPEKTNIIQEAADAIERNWEEEASFNREAVETVRVRSSTIFHAYAFLRLSANTYTTTPDEATRIPSLAFDRSGPFARLLRWNAAKK